MGPLRRQQDWRQPHTPDVPQDGVVYHLPPVCGGDPGLARVQPQPTMLGSAPWLLGDPEQQVLLAKASTQL